MQRKTKKYALENLAPYIRILVQSADKIIKIIPLFWDRRKNAVTTAKDVATFPSGFRHGLGRHKENPGPCFR